MFVADDLGLEVGAYGDPVARTPSIDRFGEEGMLFWRAYATTALCCPSRAALYTGLYPHSIGMLGMTGDGFRLAPRVATIALLARRAGYWAAGAGKLHVLPQERFPWSVPWRKLPKGDSEEIARITGELLDLGLAAEQPVFLMINPHDPHRPLPGLEQLPESIPRYRPEEIELPPFFVRTPKANDEFARYRSAVSRLDRTFGRVLLELDRRGLRDRTLVIVTSDQGLLFDGAKRTLYEPGVRVPFIVRWPGHVEPGQRVDVPISLVDVVPTLLDVMQANPRPRLHGISLRPILESGSGDHPPVFGSHTFALHRVYYPQRSIVKGRYKYIRNLRPDIEPHPRDVTRSLILHSDEENRARIRRLLVRPAEEFYDLVADPWELENLADRPDYAATLGSLQDELRRFLDRTGDPLLDLWDRGPGSGDPHEPTRSGARPWQPHWLPADARELLLRPVESRSR